MLEEAGWLATGLAGAKDERGGHVFMCVATPASEVSCSERLVGDEEKRAID